MTDTTVVEPAGLGVRVVGGPTAVLELAGLRLITDQPSTPQEPTSRAQASPPPRPGDPP